MSFNIAIVGMGCIYPGAHSPKQLWENVLAGRRTFRKAPDERLPNQYYYDEDPDAAGKTYNPSLSVISDWTFNPLDFRISPSVFRASEISHWLALDVAKQALEDAQIKLDEIDRARAGVILGNTLGGEFFRSHNMAFRWPYVARALRHAFENQGIEDHTITQLLAAVKHEYLDPLPPVNEDSLAGNMANTIVGRICNYYDFGGGGYTVDGACSSSLLAISHACNALINHEMDFALAGGVDISLDPFEVVGFAKARALTTTDIRPYDTLANGMMTGEGCGIFVLLREADAKKLNCKIYATIKGWGHSTDGAGGITSPEVEGQTRALKRAYEKAAYPISSVGYFEGHGTGTALGDKVEIKALKNLIEAEADGGPCWIGSIKANIGHCKAAAGAAGLIKAVMAVHHKVIPPTVNCDEPNAEFGRPLNRLRPTIKGNPWDQQKNQPRRAAVSAMGFGGANTHITIEETDPGTRPNRESLHILGSYRKTELMLISGNSPAEIQSQIEKIQKIADAASQEELIDLSAALAKKTNHGRFRLALVVDNVKSLRQKINGLSNRFNDKASFKALNDPINGIFSNIAKKKAKIVALYPGQASQRLNMCEFLFNAFPTVRQLTNDIDSALSSIFPESLKYRFLFNTLSHNNDELSDAKATLNNTKYAQPSIMLCEMAISKIFSDLGFQADIAIGHSLGEIAALYAAGAYDEKSAILFAAWRGKLMGELTLADPGAMLAVFTHAEQVQALIQQSGNTLSIANYNAPTQIIVSGATQEISSFEAFCHQQKVRTSKLNVSHAFHSPKS